MRTGYGSTKLPYGFIRVVFLSLLALYNRCVDDVSHFPPGHELVNGNAGLQGQFINSSSCSLSG